MGHSGGGDAGRGSEGRGICGGRGAKGGVDGGTTGGGGGGAFGGPAKNASHAPLVVGKTARLSVSVESISENVAIASIWPEPPSSIEAAAMPNVLIENSSEVIANAWLVLAMPEA